MRPVGKHLVREVHNSGGKWNTGSSNGTFPVLRHRVRNPALGECVSLLLCRFSRTPAGSPFWGLLGEV